MGQSSASPSPLQCGFNMGHPLCSENDVTQSVQQPIQHMHKTWTQLRCNSELHESHATGCVKPDMLWESHARLLQCSMQSTQ